MAFLDEEEDELALPEERGRPHRPPRPPRTPRQQLLVRRLVAVGVGVLFLILIVVGIKGCLNARKERAIKDFGTRAAALVTESDQVGNSFFNDVLQKTSTLDATEISTQVKSFRGATASQYERLNDLSAPSEMSAAKQQLLTAFALRRNGMAVIADNIDQAFAKEGAIDAQDAISSQMKLLYASDQVYTGVVLPTVDEVVEKEGVSDFPALPAPCSTGTAASSSSSTSTGGSTTSGTTSSSSADSSANPFATTPDSSDSSDTTSTPKPITATGSSCPNSANSVFVPAPAEEWLDEATITEKLGEVNGAASTAEPTSGIHGMQLLSTKIGDTQLIPGTPITVPAGNPVLNVEVSNGGDSEESSVNVTVNVGGDTQELPIPRIGPGETQVLKFPLTTLPPSGEQTEITVDVEPVPGELDESNNSSTYTVTFQ